MLFYCKQLIRKDILLLFGRSTSILQAFLLGLVLLFLFSLSSPTGELVAGHAAATIFWLATAYSQVLIFSTLFSFEESRGQRVGLFLSPAPAQSIWLAKGICGLLVLLFLQALFLLAIAVFLRHSPQENFIQAFLGVFLCDLGLCALGSLLGSVSQGQSAKESLLSLVLFPLLLPLFLMGISLLAESYIGNNSKVDLTKFQFILAYDLIFIGAAYVLFPFVYDAEEN